MRSVLITGGFGYIGGRVAQHLSQAGWKIVIATRQYVPAPSWLPEAEVRQIDWHNADQVFAVCAEMDAIVHMAAMNEHECLADPVAALQVNGVYSVALLRAAIKTKIKRFIYLSTAHVYGAPLQGTLRETTLAKPIHPYASSHRAAEDVVLAAHAKKEIEGVVLRLSNGFGAPTHAAVSRWTLLANDLCRQAIEAGTLTLQSAGLQRRDFVTLHDVARAVEHMLALDSAKVEDGLFNLGGGWAPRIIDMAMRVQQRCRVVFGHDVPLQLPEADPKQEDVPLNYQIDKLLATGFALNGSIDAELDATLQLCKENFKKQ